MKVYTMLKANFTRDIFRGRILDCQVGLFVFEQLKLGTKVVEFSIGKWNKSRPPPELQDIFSTLIDRSDRRRDPWGHVARTPLDPPTRPPNQTPQLDPRTSPPN